MYETIRIFERLYFRYFAFAFNRKSYSIAFLGAFFFAAIFGWTDLHIQGACDEDRTCFLGHTWYVFVEFTLIIIPGSSAQH